MASADEGFMGFLRNLTGGRGPQTNDPTKYDRYYKIEGEKGSELLLKHAQLLHLEQEMRRIGEELDIISKKHDLALSEFYRDLKKTYPDLSGHRPGGGIGYREFEGSLWAVAWDAKNPKQGTDEVQQS